LITSYFSKIYAISNKIQEIKYLRQIHLIVIGVAFFVFLGVLLFGAWLIQNLYGVDFVEAVKLLPYIVLATLLSALGTISYRYIIKLNGYKYLSIKMLVISLISIPFSYLFIRNYGIFGAAYCFIAIEFLSLTIANYLFKNGCILEMHLNTFGLNFKTKG
jgi:O-antigen/teichoic acid export membrane protein